MREGGGGIAPAFEPWLSSACRSGWNRSRGWSASRRAMGNRWHASNTAAAAACWRGRQVTTVTCAHRRHEPRPKDTGRRTEGGEGQTQHTSSARLCRSVSLPTRPRSRGKQAVLTRANAAGAVQSCAITYAPAIPPRGNLGKFLCIYFLAIVSERDNFDKNNQNDRCHTRTQASKRVAHGLASPLTQSPPPQRT